jgi:hypothetical protein
VRTPRKDEKRSARSPTVISPSLSPGSRARMARTNTAVRRRRPPGGPVAVRRADTHSCIEKVVHIEKQSSDFASPLSRSRLYAFAALRLHCPERTRLGNAMLLGQRNDQRQLLPSHYCHHQKPAHDILLREHGRPVPPGGQGYSYLHTNVREYEHLTQSASARTVQIKETVSWAPSDHSIFSSNANMAEAHCLNFTCWSTHNYQYVQHLRRLRSHTHAASRMLLQHNSEHNCYQGNKYEV